MIIRNLIKYGLKVSKSRHQRQALADKVSTPMQEMDFINRMIENDSKNYHAWSYRQWVIQKYQLWDFEWVDVARLIAEDVRNNSAWNQRYFCLKNMLQKVQGESELQYIFENIKLAPLNESPWNYLQGVLKLMSLKLLDFPILLAKVESYSNESNRFAMTALVNLYKSMGKASEYQRMCKTLEGVDSIRQRYWEFRGSQNIL